MNKNFWLDLCVEMMIAYIPREFTTREIYRKFQEISDHFISVSTILSERIKLERNISELMIDDNDDVKRVAQLIKLLARQDFEYIKRWAVKEGLYAESR